jgi:hypothetical protein
VSNGSALESVSDGLSQCSSKFSLQESLLVAQSVFELLIEENTIKAATVGSYQITGTTPEAVIAPLRVMRATPRALAVAAMIRSGISGIR